MNSTTAGLVGYDADGHFVHYCHCGRFGAFGYGVDLHAGKLGVWFCGEHNPSGPTDTSRACAMFATRGERWCFETCAMPESCTATPRPKEPHPLPKTRQWVEDFKKYGTDPKPKDKERPAAINFVEWLKTNPYPDLQEFVAHFGGYDKITPKAWAEYDKAVANWRQQRQERGTRV